MVEEVVEQEEEEVEEEQESLFLRLLDRIPFNRKDIGNC